MNNVVIYKPATEGYEDAPAVILQGHMDMVCEKRPDVDHDFTKDPLNISVKDGYVTANGTTLGGDDGLPWLRLRLCAKTLHILRWRF